MSELEAVIRSLLEKYTNAETWRIASLADCSERTVRRVKQNIREEKDEADNKELIAACITKKPDMVNSPPPTKPTALGTQVDGSHYKKLKIQPVEYIHANGLGFFEGTAIGYLTRWRDKGGVKDLKKAIHTVQLLIELDNKELIAACITKKPDNSVAYFINGQRVEEKVYKAQMINKQQKETTMTDNKTEALPHLALRRQWLDDIEKNPKCVWRARSKGSKEWSLFAPGVQPHWHPDNEYSPQPKTKTYYMVMVKHSGVGDIPFGLVFKTKEEVAGYLKHFGLNQIGDVVPREVEQ